MTVNVWAGLLVFLTDIHALGLATAQGLIFTETFYWDMNDRTRAFSRRFAAQDKGIHPTMVPFTGTAPVWNAMLGGRVSSSSCSACRSTTWRPAAPSTQRSRKAR